MPDTLLILIISMLFFLFLAYLPIYFWIAEKNLTILNFVDGRHNSPEKGLKAKMLLWLLKIIKKHTLFSLHCVH